MKMNNIYITQPNFPSLDDFIPYLEQIWKNKILTNGGELHQQLESALCDFLKVPYICLFNNGTNALLTALNSLELEGEVITTPFTFAATTHSIVWNNLAPVFVDIELPTLNINPARIEAAITDRTSAIMPVHCYGNPCDVELIETIANRHGLRIIYDAAHAFAVQTPKGSLLQYGDLSVLSFHATKVFNTVEGGAIVCHSKDMKQKIDQLKNFGIVDEANFLGIPGLNGKMNEFQAAFGLLQLQNIDELIKKRKEISNYYCRELSSVNGLSIVMAMSATVSNHAYFPILVEEDYPLTRDELYCKLKEVGIYSRRYFYPLISNLSCYSGLTSARRTNLPIANQMAEKILCLPIYPALEDVDLLRIINQLRSD